MARRTSATLFRGSCVAALLAVAACAPAVQEPADQALPSAASLPTMAVPFVENRGQVHGSVAFYADAGNARVFLTDDGLTYAMAMKQQDASPQLHADVLGQQDSIPPQVLSLKETFIDSRPLTLQGGTPAPTIVSIFHGSDPSTWRSAIPTFADIDAGEPWDGIRLTYRLQKDGVEKVFTVAPGMDPSHIRIAMDGVTEITPQADGSLAAEAATGDSFRVSPLVAYQMVDGQRRSVAAHYSVEGSTYGIVLGDYDASLPLIIDPLLGSTYIGGSSSDTISRVAVGSSGEAYVAWNTPSSDIPDVSGTYQTSNAGSFDVVIAKLDTDLETLTAVTYLGSSGIDQLGDMVLNGSNVVFVAGTTDGTFPTTVGAVKTTSNGSKDAFMAVLSSDLTSLNASTMLGGTSNDFGNAIGLSSGGDVYIAGSTASSDFPATAGAYTESLTGGGSDAFVALLSADATTISSATFLGGAANTDTAKDLAVDGSDNVYLTGQTVSTNFPVNDGAGQGTYGGGTSDGFVVKMNAALSTLVGSTYLGGTSFDIGVTIGLDPTGNVWVGGYTQSTDFPVSSGVYTSFGGGTYDAFLVKLDASAESQVVSTFYGGDGNDDISSIDFDSAERPFVVGTTRSTDLPLTSGAYDETLTGGGDYDVFIARFATDLSTLDIATTIKGASPDIGEDIELYSTTAVYISGYTYGADFPTCSGSYDTSLGGTNDIIIAKLDQSLSAGVCGASAVCGNGAVEGSEECDDGNAVNTDACTNSCTNATCGDSIVWSGNEDCDDGNAVNTDACTNACESATCGDGYVWAGNEECDDANAVNTDACTNACEDAVCGDGIVRTGVEACDDGNVVNDDACTNSCALGTCGDSIVQSGEDCDDGNADDTDSCLSTCISASCGDGYVWSGQEECDGGDNDSAACDSDCTAVVCGDAHVNVAAGEQCDPPSPVNRCTASCKEEQGGAGSGLPSSSRASAASASSRSSSAASEAKVRCCKEDAWSCMPELVDLSTCLAPDTQGKNGVAVYPERMTQTACTVACKPEFYCCACDRPHLLNGVETRIFPVSFSNIATCSAYSLLLPDDIGVNTRICNTICNVQE